MDFHRGPIGISIIVFFLSGCRNGRRSLTVLPDVHTDGVRRGDVGIRGSHGSAGGPHVEEEEHGYRREAEDCDEGQSEDVGQEHELRERAKVRGKVCASDTVTGHLQGRLERANCHSSPPGFAGDCECVLDGSLIFAGVCTQGNAFP